MGLVALAVISGALATSSSGQAQEEKADDPVAEQTAPAEQATADGPSADPTEVTDEGLARLRGSDALVALNLRGTRITDAGLDHLRAFPGLRVLNFAETAITSRNGVG